MSMFGPRIKPRPMLPVLSEPVSEEEPKASPCYVLRVDVTATEVESLEWALDYFQYLIGDEVALSHRTSDRVDDVLELLDQLQRALKEATS